MGRQVSKDMHTPPCTHIYPSQCEAAGTHISLSLFNTLILKKADLQALQICIHNVRRRHYHCSNEQANPAKLGLPSPICMITSG